MTLFAALIPAFFVISLAYSTVGLGGGSAYIAALVLAGAAKGSIPAIALTCNILVAAQGFIQFKKAGHLRWDLLWPFAISSIPLAYVGGRLPIHDEWLTIIFAAALSIAALRLLFWRRHDEGAIARFWSRRRAIPVILAAGSLLGLVAGVTGIGGGIYLIPTVLILKLAGPKEAAALASPFIVVNSAAGLAGQLSKGLPDPWAILPLAGAVIIGGFIGSRLGATRLKAEALQRIVGAMMLIAVGKLVWGLMP